MPGYSVPNQYQNLSIKICRSVGLRPCPSTLCPSCLCPSILSLPIHLVSAHPSCLCPSILLVVPLPCLRGTASPSITNPAVVSGDSRASHLLPDTEDIQIHHDDTPEVSHIGRPQTGTDLKSRHRPIPTKRSHYIRQSVLLETELHHEPDTSQKLKMPESAGCQQQETAS